MKYHIILTLKFKSEVEVNKSIMPGVETFQPEAGYSIPEGRLFYIQREGQSKIFEIRKVCHFTSGVKYLIDRKMNDFSWVDINQFYYVKPGYKMNRIE